MIVEGFSQWQFIHPAKEINNFNVFCIIRMKYLRWSWFFIILVFQGRSSRGSRICWQHSLPTYKWYWSQVFPNFHTNPLKSDSSGFWYLSSDASRTCSWSWLRYYISLNNTCWWSGWLSRTTCCRAACRGGWVCRNSHMATSCRRCGVAGSWRTLDITTRAYLSRQCWEFRWSMW